MLYDVLMVLRIFLFCYGVNFSNVYDWEDFKFGFVVINMLWNLVVLRIMYVIVDCIYLIFLVMDFLDLWLNCFGIYGMLCKDIGIIILIIM